jgi:hypothetical protein
MLIDDFMPKYDFSEYHDIKIRAGAADVYRAIHEIDVADSSIISWLLWLRGMKSSGPMLKGMREHSFELLGEDENREMVIGLAGQFWRPTGNMQKINAGSFKEFDKPGFAKAAWNFSLNETSGETNLATETRIRCMDDSSRSRFGFYWAFIQPFSGWIRMEMLKLVKKKAEREDAI